MPRQTSVQITEATERQLEALKLQGYGSTTDIIRVAIDRMWRHECIDLAPKPSVQIWQHSTAGERYIVLCSSGVVGAYGPIVHSEQDALLAKTLMPSWQWDAELADWIDDHEDEYRVVWPNELV